MHHSTEGESCTSPNARPPPPTPSIRREINETNDFVGRDETRQDERSATKRPRRNLVVVSEKRREWESEARVKERVITLFFSKGH